VHVADQHPAEGIIATAGKQGCDLIVMASHGRRAVGRLLLGSQASEVLAHSKVPTLIVR
jgi:nucleotide-binding universal stress UspA family protein